MRKIRCSYCGEIFNVDDDKEIVYCPKCYKDLNVNYSVKNLSNYIAKHFSNAITELNESTEYQKAVNNFQAVLDIYPNDIDAIKGLILSSLLCSTIRKSYINESLHNLIRYKDKIQINNLSIEDTLEFAQKINNYLDLYIDTMKKRLSNDGHFYEEKGLFLYKKALKDVIDFKGVLIDFFFTNRKLPHDEVLSKKKIEKQIKFLKEELNKNVAVETNPLYRLDTDVKECYILDTIFPDNRKLFKQKTSFLILFLVFFFIMVIGIILIFVLPKKLLIGVPLTSIGFVCSLLFLIIDIFIVKKLSQ